MASAAAASSGDFKQFDVVCGAYNDNFFRDGPTRPSPGLHKKIMKEWRILEKDLPDSIFVRAYDNHIDFLRAAIIGAAGTPYHDGLFFFDLHFPSDYPASPPRVYYHSHGLRLNPNLYASGKVCLSLLNTWNGRKSERWNPKESTILQVLVSIQALVLNSRPYFNEPGAGFFGNWEKVNSRAYSENAFVLTCKTAVYLLLRPPTCFEELVAGHFSRRAGAMLGACRAYAEGRVMVGEYNGGETAAVVRKGDVSRKFRESLEWVYKELVAALKARGVSVEGVPEVLKVETTASGEREGNNSNGIFWRFVEKMKEALGLKKKKKKKKKKKTKKKNKIKNAVLIGWNGEGGIQKI